MPISPTLPADGESNWDVSLNAALTVIVDEVNAQETDIAAALTTAAAPELIRDTIGTALVAGSNVTITVNDGSDTITIAATGGGGGAVDSVNGATGTVVLDQDDVLDGTTYKQYSATEKTKLAGIATGATANSSDATLLARANHTGTQTASTISDFATTVRATTGSDTAAGSLELATDAEAVTGTDTARAVTPANVAAVIAVTRARFSGFNAQTGTTYTPVLSDEGKLITLTNAAAITVTLPQNSDLAYPLGATLMFLVKGAGMATFVAGTGATKIPTGTLTSRVTGAFVEAVKVATNEWAVSGDIA